MSLKERRASIAEEQKRLAHEEKERKRDKRKSMVTLGLGIIGPNDLESKGDEEQGPAMPVCQMNPQKHRVKCVRLSLQPGERAVNTLAARPVGKKEIKANPKAQQAFDLEWEIGKEKRLEI